MQQGSNNYNNNNNNGVHPACAACKHQRKKCNDECILAPYFPAERSREFQAVHKVFGVSNVTKMVRSVRVDDRPRTVDSLIWEAFCRQNDPVLGSYGEYQRVCEELKFYKNQALLQLQNQNPNSNLNQNHNQNPFVRGDMMHKSVQPNGLNRSNVMNVNKGVGGGFVNIGGSYHTNNENLIADFDASGTMSAPVVHNSRALRHEESAIPVLQQQHYHQQEVINGINQDYYTSSNK